MGCSFSKELVERPSRKASTNEAAWEAVLARGLALHLNTSFKRMNGGYISAIFSANYASTLGHHARLKAFHRDDLLLYHNLPRFAEDNPQSKASKLGVNTRAQKMKLSEIEPIPSWDKLKEQFTAGKSIEGAKVALEIIDTWELLEDINVQEEDHLNVGSLDVNDDPTLITNRHTPTTPFFAKPSHDTLLSTASSTTAFTALIPQSKSLTSSQGTDDVNSFVAASEDVVLTLDESLCPELHDVSEVKELSRPSFRKPFDKIYGGDIAFEDGGLPTCQRACEMTSNTEIQPISSAIESQAWKPLNIQTALSMKYILNDNTSEKDESHFSAVSDANEPNAREPDEENLAFPRASLSCDSECSSSSSASLKDWLPSDSPPFTLTDSIEGGFDASILEAIQASHILLAQQMTACLLPNTRRVLSKYVGGGQLENVNPNALQSSGEANLLSIKAERCAAYMGDIECMDSLNMGIHKEQCASQSAMGSPCNLHTPVGSGPRDQVSYAHKPNNTSKLSLDPISRCKKEVESITNGSAMQFDTEAVDTILTAASFYARPHDMKYPLSREENKQAK